MSQVIDRLAPYPLKDRALVLREAYGLDSAAAVAQLLQQTDEDQEDIGRAAAWPTAAIQSRCGFRRCGHKGLRLPP